MTRKECLEQAMGCVLKDRNASYGGPEDNFGRIAKLWSTYTGTVLDGIDVAMMMALLKVARIRNNKEYSDGYIDLAGYAACGAELAGKAEAYRQFIEKAGAEYKRLRAEADEEQAKTFAKHNPPEEPEFEHGEAVEWNGVGSAWLPAVYLREFGDFGHCAIQIDGRERIVCKVDLRRPEANNPENPDSSPEFKSGDRVLLTMPEGEDVHCVYIGESTHSGCCCVRYLGGDNSGDTDDTVPIDQLRRVPVSKAEGCEALVEHDAPQTSQELYQHIVDCNPATYSRAHKPTGEKLAEMAGGAKIMWETRYEDNGNA